MDYKDFIAQMQAHAAARAQLLAALDQAIRDVGVECVAAALLERARRSGTTTEGQTTGINPTPK